MKYLFPEGSSENSRLRDERVYINIMCADIFDYTREANLVYEYHRPCCFLVEYHRQAADDAIHIFVPLALCQLDRPPWPCCADFKRSDVLFVRLSGNLYY